MQREEAHSLLASDPDGVPLPAKTHRSLRWPVATTACYCVIMTINGGMCGAFGPALEVLGRKTGLSQAVLCLLYTSPSPRDATLARMPSSA